MPDIEVENREQVADWVETTLIARNGPIGIDALAECARQDCAIDDAKLSTGLQVMRRRARLLGTTYPFELTKIAVRPQFAATSSIYTALLLLSPGAPLRQLTGSKPTNDMAVLFERITVDATKALLGSSSDAVRFGWPSDQGRPERFSEAIEWLAKRMGVESGSAFRPPKRKDGGVDVVAWRSFPDGRKGFPVSLVQCTLQKDIVPKSRDIDLRIWSGWLTLVVDPITILAIPGTINSNEDWDEIAVRSLILDRIRIADLLSGHALVNYEWGESFTRGAMDQISEQLAGALKK